MCPFRLLVEITQLTTEKEKYQEKLVKNSIFQKYMEKVQESSDEFSEIREIIGRYDTLVATHLVRFDWIFYALKICEYTE